MKSCATWWVSTSIPRSGPLSSLSTRRARSKPSTTPSQVFPSSKGRAGTMTHGYKRHGTTTLFAALDVATGEVVHECLPAPPASGVSAVPPQDRAQRGFRTRHPRDSPTTTPPTSIRPSGRGSTNTLGSTSTSFPLHPLGSNLVERFFSELTTRQLKRLAVTSVDQLIEAINHYIDRRNDNPTPFVWIASAQSIIAKVSKAKETLATQH